MRPDASFCLIGHHKAIFSEGQQTLFGLEDAAAYVWCRLEDDLSAVAIVAELVQRGMARPAAESAILTLIEYWLQNDLIEFIVDDVRPEPSQTINIEVGQLRAQIGFSNERLARRVAPQLTHLETTAAPEIDYLLHACGDFVHLFQGSRHLSLARSPQVMPVLQRYLTEAIIERLGADLVLHAATLIKDGHALLLSGRPGAGKTTLALALVDSGFVYGGDDIAILDAKGRVQGIPFAPAVKSGSWPLVEDAKSSPIHKRLDGRRVRYVSPRRYAERAFYPVRAIVFLKRQASGSVALKPLPPFDALAMLIDGGLSADGIMTNARLKALKSCLSEAGLYELCYARLDEAVSALECMWDDA